MTYTFVPKQKHAKAYGRNMRISRKAAVKICRVISKKPLARTERLLKNLLEKKQSLRGKYYTSAVNEINDLIESCKKNAEFLGLDAEKLFVHASAHQGSIMRRRRRKSAFGSRMKSTSVEIMLVEKGKGKEKPKKDVIIVKKGDEKEMKKIAEQVAKKIEEKKIEKKSQSEEKAKSGENA